jgi:SAM-dependent methyltransferase
VADAAGLSDLRESLPGMKGLAGASIVAVGVAAIVSAQRPPPPPDLLFVPTWEPVVYQMLELAAVTRDDVVYDLGSGDGRIVILAAQKYGARGVGIELDPRLVESSRQVARDAQVDDRVRFIEGDLFTSDISDATVVTLFLSPSVNNELEPKLRRELKPGTRIVSHQFTIGKWAPEKTVRAEEDRTNLYLWRVPGPDRLDHREVIRRVPLPGSDRMLRSSLPRP